MILLRFCTKQCNHTTDRCPCQSHMTSSSRVYFCEKEGSGEFYQGPLQTMCIPQQPQNTGSQMIKSVQCEQHAELDFKSKSL